MSHQRHVLPNVIWFGISSWSSRRHHCCTWNVLQCATRISTAKKNMKKYSSQHPMHLSIHQNENELSLSSRHKCAVLPSPSSQSASFIRTLAGICRAQIESRHLVCVCVWCVGSSPCASAELHICTVTGKNRVQMPPSILIEANGDDEHFHSNDLW